MKSTHPSNRDLQDWLSFRLEQSACEAIEAHLQDCPACAETLEAEIAQHPVELSRLVRQTLLDTTETSIAAENQTGPDGIQATLNEIGSTGRNYPPVGMDSRDNDVEKIRQCGEGGIGKVWRARDPVLQRTVALKELRPEVAGHELIAKRFFREARITGQLEHPGIVSVYQFLHQDGGSCYTMRFVEGVSFSREIGRFHFEGDERDLATLIDLLEKFVGSCNAIAYAHSRDIIHRDLKSDNVMIGSYGEVTVVDWGLAKRLDEDELLDLNPDDIDDGQDVLSPLLTRAGQKLGTPAFMSPEQAAGDVGAIGKHTDVYGLASILYEILTGLPPFTGSTVKSTLQKVLNEQPVAPGTIHDHVPAELEQLCLQGLEKDPSQRLASARAFGEAVRHWIVGQAERKRSETERHRFFNLSIDMMAILDNKGRIIESNDAWQRTLGLSEDELYGKTHLSLMHPDHHDHVTRVIRESRQGMTTTDVEVRIRRRDGSWRWTLWNVTPIKDERKTYIVGRDISDRKRMEAKFAALFDSAPDAMIVVNENGMIKMVNEQTTKLFGHSKQALLEQQIEMLIPDRFRPGHSGLMDSFMKNPTVRPMGNGLSVSGLHCSGEELSLEISLSPIYLEDEILIAAAIRKQISTHA